MGAIQRPHFDFKTSGQLFARRRGFIQIHGRCVCKLRHGDGTQLVKLERALKFTIHEPTCGARRAKRGFGVSDSVAGQPFVCFAIGNRTPKMGNGFEGMEIARHQSLGRHFRRVRELSDAGFHGTEARGDPRLLRMAFTVAPLFCIQRLKSSRIPVRSGAPPSVSR